MSAAPTACSARPPISTASEGATAQIAEERVKIATPDEEEAAAAEVVGEATGGDEQRGEDDRVGVQDPGDRGEVGARERGADRGHGDVDDEEVELRHEGDGGEHDEDAPAVRIRVQFVH